MTERQTVAGAYAKIDSHEEICAVRYEGINNTLRELRFAVWAVLFGLVGWMGVQLWDGQNDRLEKLEAKPAASAVAISK